MGTTKVIAHDVVVDVGQIDLVEKVVEAGAEFQFGVFSEDGDSRQSKRLADIGIHVKVARTAEGVSFDARSSRNRTVWYLAKRALYCYGCRNYAIEIRPGHN